jgi:hypothetical protein
MICPSCRLSPHHILPSISTPQHSSTYSHIVLRSVRPTHISTTVDQLSTSFANHQLTLSSITMAPVFTSRSSRPPNRVQPPSLAPGQMADMFKAHPDLCLDLSLVPVNGYTTDGTVEPELGFLAKVTGLSNASDPSSSVVHRNVRPWAEATLSKYMKHARRHAELSKHDRSGLSPTSGGICPKHLATMHSLLAFDVSIDPDHSTNPDFHSAWAPSQAGMGYRPRVMLHTNKEFEQLHSGRETLVIANSTTVWYDPKKHRCEYTNNTGSRSVNEINCSSQAILAGTSTRYPSLASKIERGKAGLCITPMPGLFGSSKDFDCTTLRH